ncbi:hypothetical protein CH267_22265 [Rhodococcus sp. 06-621-2]|nr:hypothetical protein [Rhodococcus sp. 06-621-2]OZC50782.1 hypothetical protein CH267_22265 [Rhodococcus sp. 06-621-2]
MTDDGTVGLLVREWGSDGAWSTPEMSAYDNEGHLQRIIAATPEHVPGVSGEALTVGEFSTSAGPADVCIVDRDGSITVVECKLATNSERRRMVIGQVLDSASAISVDGEAWFRSQWARQGGQTLSDLDEGGLDQLSVDIEAGRIHLCLAVDRIDADLRRLVEYLNRITRDELRVTAVQLAYARQGNLEIFVASTYGGELAAAKARSGNSEGGRTWTKESFLDAVASEADTERAARLFTLQESLDESRGSHSEFWFGSSPSGGIFFHSYGYRFAPKYLWLNKSGTLMTSGTWNNYSQIQHHGGFSSLATFLDQDHTASATGRKVSELDLDQFWTAALQCAEAINE